MKKIKMLSALSIAVLCVVFFIFFVGLSVFIGSLDCEGEYGRVFVSLFSKTLFALKLSMIPLLLFSLILQYFSFQNSQPKFACEEKNFLSGKALSEAKNKIKFLQWGIGIALFSLLTIHIFSDLFVSEMEGMRNNYHSMNRFFSGGDSDKYKIYFYSHIISAVISVYLFIHSIHSLVKEKIYRKALSEMA